MYSLILKKKANNNVRIHLLLTELHCGHLKLSKAFYIVLEPSSKGVCCQKKTKYECIHGP